MGKINISYFYLDEEDRYLPQSDNFKHIQGGVKRQIVNVNHDQCPINNLQYIVENNKENKKVTKKGKSENL